MEGVSQLYIRKETTRKKGKQKLRNSRDMTDLLPLRSLSCGDKRRVSFRALIVVFVNED